MQTMSKQQVADIFGVNRNESDRISKEDEADEYIWLRAYASCSGYITYEKWFVWKITPKGFWIRSENDDPINPKRKKWIRPTTHFVHQTKEQAKHSLYRRKRMHVRHATRRLFEAKEQLAAIMNVLGIVEDENVLGDFFFDESPPHGGW